MLAPVLALYLLGNDLVPLHDVLEDLHVLVAHRGHRGLELGDGAAVPFAVQGRLCSFLFYIIEGEVDGIDSQGPGATARVLFVLVLLLLLTHDRLDHGTLLLETELCQTVGPFVTVLVLGALDHCRLVFEETLKPHE